MRLCQRLPKMRDLPSHILLLTLNLANLVVRLFECLLKLLHPLLLHVRESHRAGHVATAATFLPVTSGASFGVCTGSSSSSCDRGSLLVCFCSGVAAHHDVIDVGLQCHTDVLALLRLKLKDVQNARHTHLEEHCTVAGPKLHNVTELCRVQVFLGDRSEEVDPSFIDTENDATREETNGIFNSLHNKEDRVTVWQTAEDAEHLQTGIFL
mmetsp:Transcript_42095/g.51066  ORF Transcript_42095/g.51066 Transcript_42095/m.51066 type:complete len:210 (+) Transcript_42095:2368-2997(+)